MRLFNKQLLLLIFCTISTMQCANSKNNFIQELEKGYFYSSEIYWSSKTNDLELSGNQIIISYPNNNFKGKGTATFLTNEKNIFLNGKLMEFDKKISVKGYKCKIKKISIEAISKKYKINASKGGIEIQLESSLEKTIVKQSRDSINIKGRFIWKDSSITGFPANIKFTSLLNKNDSFTQKIDSLGTFELNLIHGEYSISPQLNYHWMGEEFIRIDDEKSKMKVNTKTYSKNNITIQLDTISWPNNPQKTGLLKVSDKIEFKEIDKFMDERMAFFEIPGASLSIIKDNKIIYTQEYGVTNSKTKKPVSSKTLFEAGSITKLVFAFAVMRLYERGEIDLDKPVYEYLPSKEIEDERYKLITARHILSHWFAPLKIGQYCIS